MLNTDNILNLTSQMLCQRRYVKVSTTFIRNDEYAKMTHPPHGQIDLWQLWANCPSFTRAVPRTLGKTTAQSICQNQHAVAPCRPWHLRMKQSLIVTFWECKQQSIVDPWAPHRLWLLCRFLRRSLWWWWCFNWRSPEGRERPPALSADCLLVGEEEFDPCPYPSRIWHPLHLVSLFTLPHTGSICQ